MGYYILDDRDGPVKSSSGEAYQWSIDRPYRKIVGLTRFPDGTRVSTVFLTLDHGWNGGPPVLWETMIFDNDSYDDWQERYTSYKDAVIGHLAAVKMILEKETK